ncbi:MAG TPA: DUF6519 domain-containing protein [Pyrinomonadaceae bacterium]|nr:DUF6519 domain-containing protein [Pyrinomonadaceae bacterium]
MQGEFRGDVSRDTFDPTKRFSRVLMQQGRVQLDADWNEQNDILLHYLRSLAADLIGPHGGSSAALGFELITLDTAVDGLKDANGRPLDADQIRALKNSLRDSGFLLGIGRYYVDGLMSESNDYLGFEEQSGFPFVGSLSFQEIRDKTGTFLVLLDVWERHVSCTEDGDICEVALGGPDTAARAQVVAAVIVPAPEKGGQKLYDQQELTDDIKKLKDAIAAGDQKAIDEAKAALNLFTDNVRLSLRGPGTGMLRARARITGLPEGDCNIQPEAQYRGPENQLYRVEINRGGIGWDGATDGETPAGNAATAATFKWQRDNSSISFPIVSLQGDTVSLAHLGRDTSRGLQVDDWVEIVADDLVLQGQPGPVRRVKSINPDELTITLSEGVDQNYDEDSTLHPYLRRWDQRRSNGAPADNVLLVREGSGEDLNWIELEDGVQIQFPRNPDANINNRYRAGDYWLVPARVATGDVIWPKVAAGTRKIARALPPHGIEHHYAPIGVISNDGTQKIVLEHDLRRKFNPVGV